MIRFRTRYVIPALALALAACAEKLLDQPFEKSSEETKNQQPARIYEPGKVSSISLEAFFELQQVGKALVFDARPGFLYHLDHIPGAIHLPRQRGDAHIRKLETNIKSALAAGKTIVVYCSGINCPDAMTVATQLSAFGYPVAVFSGGWDAWKYADLPTE